MARTAALRGQAQDRHGSIGKRVLGKFIEGDRVIADIRNLMSEPDKQKCNGAEAAHEAMFN